MNDCFYCVRCGACCRWEGPVRVSEEEIDAIAGYLHIPVRDFIRDHTVLTPDRRSLSLREKADGSCCYYDEKNRLCRIQSVKPAQCRDFPSRWNFPGWEKLCAGARAEKAEYPVYRGPVKLMAALVLIFGSEPFLTEVKLLPLAKNRLSPGVFSEWWRAWLESGEGFALILFPLLTASMALVLILAKLTRKMRCRLWVYALVCMLISAPVFFRNFPAALQFESLLVALGGISLWLSRPPAAESNAFSTEKKETDA